LSWTLGGNIGILSKFYPNLKFKEEILVNFKPRRFSNFSFEIHFESEEASMEKVAPHFKSFKFIFYFKFLELRKILLELKQF
jgi:hypothetical protein